MKITEYNNLSSVDRKLVTLMLRNGYVIKGNEIWSSPIAWHKGSFVRHCRNIWDAAEQLCSIIHDPDYTDALMRITSSSR